MSRDVYVMICPEPHIWDRPISSMKTYVSDTKEYMNLFLSEAEKLSKTGDVMIILPGDTFHRGFDSFYEAYYWMNYFGTLSGLSALGVYSVAGNHEFTFQHLNPFWLLADVQSPYVSSKVYNGVLSDPIKKYIKVVDQVRVRGLCFVFWHYGMDITQAYATEQAREFVVVSHNPVISRDISDLLVSKYGRAVPTAYISPQDIRSDQVLMDSRLKYLFIAHLHTAFSKFVFDEVFNHVKYDTIIRYLGSTGRTKVSELNDDDLERCFPVFAIHGDGSYAYSEIPYRLKAHDAVVDLKKQNKGKTAFQRSQAISKFKNMELTGDNLDAQVRGLLGVEWDSLHIYDNAYMGRITPELERLLQEVGRLG